MKAKLFLMCGLATIGVVQARAATETVLHNFANFPNGAIPYGTLARDAAGNLYGTTYVGGRANLGTVFELTAARKFKVRYSFKGGTDGASPYAGVALDSSGNVYGTTYAGGASGKGTVYKVTASGQEIVLHSFTGGTDGSGPYAGVVLDSSGNLYGTTYNGGTANAGVIYKVTPSGQESVLYSFTGGTDGANPYAGLTFDTAGNFYGTTTLGGLYSQGVVYKLNKSGEETVVYAPGVGCAGYTKAGVALDRAGNLYGAGGTQVYKISPAGQCTKLFQWGQRTAGGNASATPVLDAAGNIYGTADPVSGAPGGPSPYGSVFKINAANGITVLYSFANPSMPANHVPVALNPGVVLDSAGNVYGATLYGGVSGIIYEVSAAGTETTLYNFPGAPGGTEPNPLLLAPGGEIYGTTFYGGAANVGTVYKLNAAGHETVLYSFKGGSDAAIPSDAPVALDPAGNVYGATKSGGPYNQGAVFRVDPSGQETVLYSFTGGADGGLPNGVIIDPSGNLYGTTFAGGSGSGTQAQEGVVFKLDPSGNETVLYSFTGLSDGGGPTAGVIRDSAGNLYGTTNGGGLGAGVVYEIDAAGLYTVLYSFTGGDDGGNPSAGVVRDPAGNLYGTNENYGAGHGGVVYKLDTAGNLTVLYSFAAGSGGNLPGGVVLDRAGNVYGATQAGGSTGCYRSVGCGTVYEIDTAGVFTVLHTFTGGTDGEGGSVVVSPAGSLYGNSAAGALAGGLVYKLALQ